MPEHHGRLPAMQNTHLFCTLTALPSLSSAWILGSRSAPRRLPVDDEDGEGRFGLAKDDEGKAGKPPAR
jgi:hypothetical protein